MPVQVALYIEDQEAGGQADSDAGLAVMVMLLVEPVPEIGIQGMVMVWMLVSADGEVEPVSGPATEEDGEGVEVGKVRVGRGVHVAGPVEAEAGEADGLMDGVPRLIQVRLSEELELDVVAEPVSGAAMEDEGEGVEVGKVRVGRGVQVAGPVEAEAGDADGFMEGVPRVIHVRLSVLEVSEADVEVGAGP